MAEFTRQTPDIGVANYIAPGVQDNSAASLLKVVGEGAMAIDTEISKRRFAEELQSLKTARHVGAPSVVDAQEAGVAPEDKAAVDDLRANLSKRKAGADNGVISHQRFLLEGERLLRIAQARRPGLANEFRQMAADYLGSDVVGAGEAFLLNQDEAMIEAAKGKKSAEEKRAEEEDKRWFGIADKAGLGAIYQSFGNDPVGRLNAFYGNDSFRNELMSYYDLSNRQLTLEAGASIVNNKATVEAPAMAANFEAYVNKTYMDYVPSIRSTVDALEKASPQQRIALMQSFMTADPNDPASGGFARLKMTRDSLVTQALANKIPKDIVDNKIKFLDGLIESVQQIASGKMEGEVYNLSIQALKNKYSYFGLNNSDTMLSVAAIDNMLPGAGSAMMTADPQLKNDVYSSILNLFQSPELADPIRIAGSAKVAVPSVLRSFAAVASSNDPAYANKKPEVAANTASFLGNMFDAFSALPDDKYAINNFASPGTGVMAEIGQIGYGTMLKANLSPEQTKDLTERANRSFFRLFQQAAKKMYSHPVYGAELKAAGITAMQGGKEGEVFIATKPLSVPAQQVLAMANKEVRPQYIYNFMRELTGQKDIPTLLKNIGQAGNRQQQQTTAAPKPASGRAKMYDTPIGKLAEGQRVTDKTTGDVYVIRNGVPVKE